MRTLLAILMMVVPLAIAATAAPAGTIELRGVYSPGVVIPDCTQAGGTRTDGIGPGGYGCRTNKGEVECTAKGRCTGICEICGVRHHRTGIYGILHAGNAGAKP